MKTRIIGLAAALACLIITGSWLAAQSGTSPGPAKDTEGTGASLDAVGRLAASHLYQTYLNIGMLADARAEGTYDTDSAREVLATVVGLVEGSEKQLDAIGRGTLTAEDKAALADVRKQSAALREVAASLDRFWKTGRKEDGARYEAQRKKAWAGIEKLLGLKDE